MRTYLLPRPLACVLFADGDEQSPGVESTHEVFCGCAIPEIGHCGNYIVVDGYYMPLSGDIGLHAAEFCRSGLLARVRGRIRKGRYVATTFRYADAR